MYYDPEEYIDVLLEYTALNRDVYYATLFEEEKLSDKFAEINKAINHSLQMDTVQIDKAKYCESLCNMYGFWYAFSNEMHYNYNFELLSRPDVFWGQGEWHHTIENLQKSSIFGSYSFTVNKVDSKDGFIYESTEYSAEYISSGSKTDLEDTLSNINQLNERIDNLMNEYASAEDIKDQFLYYAFSDEYGLERKDEKTNQKINSDELNGAILFLICGDEAENIIAEKGISYKKYESIIDIPMETLVDATNSLEELRATLCDAGITVIQKTYCGDGEEMSTDYVIEEAWKDHYKIMARREMHNICTQEEY